MTHRQSSKAPHESHGRPEHPSESVATDAPTRATTTVKNTTFKYMTATGLLLCLLDVTEGGGETYPRRNVESDTREASVASSRLALLVVAAAAAAAGAAAAR